MAIRKFRGREVSSARPRGGMMVVLFKNCKDQVTVTKAEYDLQMSLESRNGELKSGPTCSQLDSNPNG